MVFSRKHTLIQSFTCNLDFNYRTQADTRKRLRPREASIHVTTATTVRELTISLNKYARTDR